MRRLIETLIIECFEKGQISATIKYPMTGDFLYLKDLIDKLIQEPSWNLGRGRKTRITEAQKCRRQTAHGRRYNATREDIDKITTDFRVVCQELIYLDQLK
jgi:hypothetical protein